MSTMFEKGDVMQYKKVSAREKYCFGIGAIGKDAICNMVGVFLMVYFTDTLYLAPAFVGVLFFVARIWDAVNDPMMGMIVDNTHTKYGKFRIWLVIGTVVNAVVFVLLFCSFHLHGTALYTYVSVMYILYGMTYTIMDVPYWSWLPNLTNDPHEREKVSVIPRFFASLAGFCVATFGLYVITGLNKMSGKEQYAVPYFMSSHPGCGLKEAVELAEYIRDMGFMPEQVQDFYPTPSTISTCMYYTGLDPRTMEKVYVPVNPHEKNMQRALIQYRRPENRKLVEEALVRAGRQDLIGFGPKCLIRPYDGRRTQKAENLKTQKGHIGNNGKNGRGNQNQQSNGRQQKQHMGKKKTIRNVHKKR